MFCAPVTSTAGSVSSVEPVHLTPLPRKKVAASPSGQRAVISVRLLKVAVRLRASYVAPGVGQLVSSVWSWDCEVTRIDPAGTLGIVHPFHAPLGGGGVVLEAAWTEAVCDEVALLEPAVLVPAARTRSVLPTSGGGGGGCVGGCGATADGGAATRRAALPLRALGDRCSAGPGAGRRRQRGTDLRRSADRRRARVRRCDRRGRRRGRRPVRDDDRH